MHVIGAAQHARLAYLEGKDWKERCKSVESERDVWRVKAAELAQMLSLLGDSAPAAAQPASTSAAGGHKVSPDASQSRTGGRRPSSSPTAPTASARRW